MIMLSPSKVIDGLDHKNNEVMIISSPIRLIVGGRARLVRLARIHMMAISGKIV